jgi:hypothetical protein
MSQQLQITGGAKVRSLEGVITGTTGVLSSLPINGSLGIPQLDVNGKILVSQLPNSVMEYKGTWSALTNTPTLADGTGNQGDVYLCNAAATTGTSVNFGSGAIVFYVGDQVIYSGTIWQRASGASGTVTSVAVTESGDALTITGSPITTSGTINIGFAGTGSQYIKGDGTLATFPTTIEQAQKLITEVYNESGATLTKGTVVYINGGHGNLPTITKAIATGDATSAQTYGVVQTDITNMNNGYVVVIGSLGDLDTQAYANGTQLYLSSTTAGAWTSVKQYAPAHLVYVGIVVRSHPTQGVVEIRIQNGFELDELHNVSAQTPSNNDGIFYNTSTSLWENKSIATALGYTPIGGSGSTGQVAFFNGGSTTLGGSSSFYWDNSTSRLGIGTNTPNASLGIVNSSSTGIQLRTSDTSNQYQANIYWDSSYGMVYGYNRIGSGTTAHNLTFYNALGGLISVPESSNNNIGFNTINPQGSSASTIYDFTSTSTNVELRLHNPTTGYTSTDGSYIKVTTTALVIGNDESSKSILINNGGFGVVTIDGTNKVALGDIGVIPMTQQLTVVGSIEAYGGSIYQTVTSSMLKANASGQIIAAVGGTDYEYPLTFSSPLVRTTNTISIPAASASVSGYLTSTDWNTFNNKGSGTVTSVSGTAPVVSSGGTTPTISMAAATTSVSGYLTSTDWTTFNNKFTLPSLTQGSVLFSNGSTIAQNNNRLYWDNTNMRFGVGSQSVSQYVMYVAANVGENANAWLGIDNKNATGSTAVRLILNGSTTSGFQYVQSTNMTQVYANAGDIQLINGSSLGLTIANTSGIGTFSAGVRVTNDIFIGDTTTGSGRFFITDSSNQGITLRRTGATGDRFKMFVGNGTTYTQDNCIILGTNTDIDFYTGSSPLRRMTIANGGNIGIGTNAPTALLHLSQSASNLNLYLQNTSGSGKTWALNSDTNGKFNIHDTTANYFTITSGGNVGIGTTSPASGWKLTTKGTYGIVTQANANEGGAYLWHDGTDANLMASYESTGGYGAIKLLTSGVERMRITSGGNVGIGNTGGSGIRLYVTAQSTSTGDYGLVVADSASTNLFFVRNDGGICTGLSTNSPYNLTTGNAANCFINTNGYLYRSTSSLKYKTDVKDYTKGLNEVLQLRPVFYKGKGENDGDKQYAGLIAEDVHELGLTEFVQYAEDGTPDALAYQNMIALLTKAIQELSAQVNELKNK